HNKALHQQLNNLYISKKNLQKQVADKNEKLSTMEEKINQIAEECEVRYKKKVEQMKVENKIKMMELENQVMNWQDALNRVKEEGKENEILVQHLNQLNQDRKIREQRNEREMEQLRLKCEILQQQLKELNENQNL